MKIERNWFKELRQETENKGFWTRGTKVNVGIALMVVTILLSAGILQATRTFTDSNDTHTGTIVYSGNFDFTSGSYFNLSKKITNSKGGIWNATESNLQLAIDDLKTVSHGGTVWIPVGEISITTTLTIQHNGTNLIGCGNRTILKLGNAQNKDILQIGYYDSTGANNLTISGILFDMNNANNDGTHDNNRNSIDIRGYSRDITIRDCFFKNGIGSYIVCGRYTSFIDVDSCNFYGMENTWNMFPGAIWFEGDYCIASHNMIVDTFACGIIFESGTSGSYANYNIADGNIITGNVAIGVYMENGRSGNGTIINNQIYNINSTAYQNNASICNAGILAQNNSIVSNNRIDTVYQMGIQSRNDVIITGNNIKNIHGTGVDGVEGAGHGIYADYGTSIISDNKIENVRDCGIYGTNGNQYVSDNIIKGYGYIGVYKCEIVKNNKIINGGDYGIHTSNDMQENYIYIVRLEGIKPINPCSIISDNTITNITLSNGFGIDILAAAHNCTVNGNIITGFKYAISLYDARNTTLTGNRCYTCTNGIDERGTSTYTLCVANNCKTCTDGIDVDGAGSVNEHNLE
jgi:parallel beta-helix repeat protein